MGNRHVRWNDKGQTLFSSAENNSLDIDTIISFSCDTQSGNSFEELVDTLNSKGIKEKIKSLTIVDTAYLYRHYIPVFSQLSNKKIKSDWLLNNEESISKIDVPFKYYSWTERIDSDEFRKWNKQIRIDYEGDENGEGVIQSFRELVVADSAVASSKRNIGIEPSINFLLEEIAYVCAFFQKKTYLIYPMTLANAMIDALDRYRFDYVHIRYKVSKQLQKRNRHSFLDHQKINDEVSVFMRERVSSVNFFVIDKLGNHIYKNCFLDNIVGNANARNLTEEAWKTNLLVMNKREQIVREEEYNGKSYLSIKAPLIVDNRVEGVIGLAVDVTERKRAKELESENELQRIKIKNQKKIRQLSEQISHDMQIPLIELSMFADQAKGLSEEDRVKLRNAVANIRGISSQLLIEHHSYNLRETSSNVNQYISVTHGLIEIIENKKHRYANDNVNFNFKNNLSEKIVFIRGDFIEYCRMISNIINNAVESMLHKSEKTVDIGVRLNDDDVEISIRDYGVGMSKGIVDKIVSGTRVKTTKDTGYGLGLQQIRHNVEVMNGKMFVDSEEKKGTMFTLAFKRAVCPCWLLEKAELPRKNLIIVLDDDIRAHEFWKNKLALYEDDIDIKYFISGTEAIGFINSSKNKSDIFLITDYDLRNQEINGIDVIKKCGMQNKHILFTGCYFGEVSSLFEKNNFLKIFHKSMMESVTIVVK